MDAKNDKGKARHAKANYTSAFPARLEKKNLTKPREQVSTPVAREDDAKDEAHHAADDSSDHEFERMNDPWGIAASKKTSHEKLNDRMAQLDDLLKPSVRGTVLDPRTNPAMAPRSDRGRALLKAESEKAFPEKEKGKDKKKKGRLGS
ncbi:hypothetical protein OQA88_4550 [Cercophora sp. LCS_1]